MRCASSIAVWGLCLAVNALLYAQSAPEEAAAARIQFEDGSQSSGLSSFTFVSGGPEQDYIIEAMGGGVCLLDYDGDGFLDVYFVNGGQVDRFKAGLPSGLHNALYRNQGDRTFHDVTEEAGVPGNGTWGHGCSVADYNNDGRPDLYVTNYGPNILYRNLGNGRFEDVTATVGVNDPRWSTGSAWADYNGDGWPDLFVANYQVLDPGNMPEPGSKEYGTMAGAGAAPSGCIYNAVPVMCGPAGFPGAGDTLFRNNGDGTFADVSKEAGVDDPDEYYGLGVLWCDFDNDTHPDLYVANDTQGNYLYHNRGDGTFEEIGFLSGVAANERGSEQSGMGVSCGDYENNGRLGIYVTNFADDTSTLYRNDGQMYFLDITFAAGLGPVTLPFVSFGTFFFDVDNDGWLDLFVATGHVYPQIEKVTDLKTYRQRNQLFRNLGNGHFQEVKEKTLGTRLAVSRGTVWGDFDNDGALDVIVANLNDPPTLLWNRTEPRQNYLVVMLEGTTSNRDSLGARVRLRTGSQWQLREVQSGGSYLCGHDSRLHFGLGKATIVDEIRVWWPSGVTSVLREVPANQFLTLREPRPEPDTAPASPSPAKD